MLTTPILLITLLSSALAAPPSPPPPTTTAIAPSTPAPASWAWWDGLPPKTVEDDTDVDMGAGKPSSWLPVNSRKEKRRHPPTDSTTIETPDGDRTDGLSSGNNVDNGKQDSKGLKEKRRHPPTDSTTTETPDGDRVDGLNSDNNSGSSTHDGKNLKEKRRHPPTDSTTIVTPDGDSVDGLNSGNDDEKKEGGKDLGKRSDSPGGKVKWWLEKQTVKAAAKGVWKGIKGALKGSN